MRRWSDSTFVFVSANHAFEPGCVEERWLPVLRSLAEKGARVRVLAAPAPDFSQAARAIPGVVVDPYILDRWNLIRSRSRLRKYLRRFDPVLVHSTGLEADLVVRWAARKVAATQVVETLTMGVGVTSRTRPVDALMRRFDELGIRTAAAVFVDDESVAAEVRAAGVAGDRITLDPPSAGAAASVAAHLGVYRDLMALRGASG